jgi:predicted amidohydrolase
MSGVRFAAIQMNSHADVSANISTATSMLDRAADNGAVLAVLPENFAGMGANESYRVDIAEPDGNGPVQDCLSAAASRNGMWIVGGTVPLQGDDPQRPFASCLVYDDQGHRVARYDKIHLFDVAIPGSDESYRESAHTTPGREPLLLDTPWGGLGIGVCYDLRFPEMFRFQPGGRMNILAIPAAFTFATGQAHWELLLRARAIENLCYVVAAAQTGMHPGGRRTWGHSMIVDPWGQKLDVLDDAVDSISSEVDLDRLSSTREKFPALSHRRLRVSDYES